MGGGVGLQSGAVIVAKGGAKLLFENNSATHYGGGAWLQGNGTSLTASNAGTHVEFRDNTASDGVPGLALYTAAAVRIGPGVLLVGQPSIEVTALAWCVTTPAAGAHALRGGSVCMLTGSVFVETDSALWLSTETTTLASLGPAVVSGGGTSRLFYIDGGELTFANLILEAGRADYGGAVYANEGARLNVVAGSLSIRKNEATWGGGVYLKSRSTFSVTGNGTRVLIESNTAQYGGGVCQADYAAVVVEHGAALETRNNEAMKNGGGVYLNSRSMLTATGSGTRVVLENNTAQYGGGVCQGNYAAVVVEHGAALETRNNEAMKNGGGVYLNSRSMLTATGSGTRVVLENNTAQYGGGVYQTNYAAVVVEHGAALETRNSKAASKGGGAYLNGDGSVFTVTGNGTRVLFERNTAESGGGLFLVARAAMLVERGATLNVTGNTATSSNSGGGGIFLHSEGTYLSVTGGTGDHTCLNVINNTVSGKDGASGGGLLLGPSTSALITAPSVFRGNRADTGAGGAVAFEGTSKDDGGAACVTVSLEIFANKPWNSYYQRYWGGSVIAYTVPTTALDSRNNDWERLVDDSPSTWCLPCGDDYTLHVGTGVVNRFFGLGGRARLRLVRPGGRGPVLVEDTTTLVNHSNVALPFSLDCAEQGVRIANARFESNVARLGGALGIAPLRTKNAFFDVTASTFRGNTAAHTGGAIHLSGINSGARLTDGCHFCGNCALGEGGGDGNGGGAISVENSAGLRIRDATAADDAATGDGGFLSARYASPVLLQDVTVSRANASGGGGAMAVLATHIALEHVTIEGCSAGTGGGGGILLDGAARVDLVGSCKLIENAAATEFGGHVRLAASRLVVHGKKSSLTWPASTPVFPDEVRLGVSISDLVPTVMTKGTALSGGGVFCMAAARPNGAYLGLGTIINASIATGGGGAAISAILCDVTLDGASLLDNTASAGGGGAVLLGTGSKLMVMGGSDLRGNSARDSGGAISCNECTEVKLVNGTTLESNSAATGCGGAVNIQNPNIQNPNDPTATMTSLNSRFSRNTAAMDGGAVSYYDSRKSGEWSSTDDRYEGNVATAGSGGALVLVGAKAMLGGSATTPSCSGNSAPRGGGGCVMWEPLAESATSAAWQTQAPVFVNCLVSNNTAAFGDDVATPPVSLRARVVAEFEAAAVATKVLAPARGGSLAPPPQVELLDLYGEAVRGAHASAVSIGAKRLNLTATTIYGGVNSPSNAATGTAMFASLGLRGAPGSGPHRLGFFASIQAGGATSGVLRAIDSSAAWPPFEAWVEDCEENTFRDGEQCLRCPDRASIIPIPSGAMRDGPAEVACRCDEGFHNDPSVGSMNCVPCRKGETSNGTACVLCEPGTYKRVEGSSPCQPCPKDTFNAKRGATTVAECLACPQGRTTGSINIGSTNQTDCECRAESSYNGDGNVCAPCPPGADCSTKNGMVLSELSAKTGRWRAHPNTIVFADCADGYAGPNSRELANARCCPVTTSSEENASVTVSICMQHDGQANISLTVGWNSDHQCAPGYVGPMCRACDAARGYVAIGQGCTHCDGGGSVGAITAVMVGVMVLLFLVVLFALLRAKPKVPQSKDALFNNKKNTAYRENLKSQVTIMISWIQILSAITVTYDGVPWPASFKSLSQGSGAVVNLDISWVLSGMSCVFSVPFSDTFLLYLSTPFLVVLAVKGAHMVSILIGKTKRVPANSTKREELAEHRRGFADHTLVVLVLLLYPGITSRIFQMFRCFKVPGTEKEVFMYDFNVDCTPPESGGDLHSDYQGYLTVAAIAMGVFAGGVPTLLFVELWRHRAHLHPPNQDDHLSKHVKHYHVKNRLGSFYEHYEPKYYFWECLLLMYKCFLTGVLIIIAPGTPTQLLVALLICTVYLLGVFKFNPFVGGHADVVATLTSVSLCITYLIGFYESTVNHTMKLNSVNTGRSKTAIPSDLLGALLITVNVIPIVFFVFSNVWHPLSVVCKSKSNSGEGTPRARLTAVAVAAAPAEPETSSSNKKANKKPRDDEDEQLRTWGAREGL